MLILPGTDRFITVYASTQIDDVEPALKRCSEILEQKIAAYAKEGRVELVGGVSVGSVAFSTPRFLMLAQAIIFRG